MKKAPRSVGYQQANYQLLDILREAHAEYIKTNAQAEQIDKDKEAGAKRIPKLFEARHRAIRNGVISVTMATSYLESAIYHYGTHFLHFKSFDNYIGSLSIVAKWLVVPRLCQGIEINEDSSEINDLKELVKARNCIIHSKIKWMTADNPFPKDLDTELARFDKAAFKCIDTVDSLIGILKAHQKK